MNFIQKCKRNGGFTLVELIVVIAILAILAGVAVPAYTGYIAKAEEAADQQLLGAVNTAFAAACLEQGVDSKDVNDAAISLKEAEGGEGNIVEKISYVAGMDAIVVNEAFQRYYAGNSTAAFKVITQLDFVDGVFMDPANSDKHEALTYNGKTVYVAKKDVEAYTNSAWGSVASKDVLSLVGNVSDMAMEIDNEIFLGMLEKPEYLNAAASALGMSAADYDKNVTAMIENAAEEWKKNNPTATDEEVENYKETVGSQIVTNNAILVAAQNAQTAGSNIMSLLTADGGKDAKKNIAMAMSSDPATGLSQAALAYGLYSSYMLSTNPSSFDPEAPLDFSAVMNTMTDEGFQTYLTEGNGQKDLEGYLAALNTVGSNSSTVGTDVVVNGFNNEDLVTLLQSAMGK